MKRILIPLLALALSTAAFADIKVKHSFSSSIASDRITRLVVNVPVGKIEIRTGPVAAIRVEGEAIREADDEQEAKEAQKIADDSSIVVRSRGRVAYVEPQYRGEADGWVTRKKTSFRVIVTAPAGLAVKVDQSVGEINITGEPGDLTLRLGVGQIHVELAKKSVRELTASATIGEVRTNFPDRTITKEGLFAGTTHYVNEGGRSTIELRVRVGEMSIDLID